MTKCAFFRRGTAGEPFVTETDFLSPKDELVLYFGPMQFRRLLLSAILLCLMVQASVAQREALFSDANAYNPVPSPDGKFVAYVQTGWNKSTEWVGSVVAIWNPQCRSPRQMERLLDMGRSTHSWVSGSRTVPLLFVTATGVSGLPLPTVGVNKRTMPDISEMRTSTFAKAERVAFLDRLQRFAWIDRRPSKTLLQTLHQFADEFL